tara:strand:- start:202 stop:567 length:366 start_codon:yes stop_codon:yes gene_type:complete
MNKKEKLENIFKYIETETDQCVTDHLDMEDILKLKSYDELYEELEEVGFFNVEIIYYTTAMDYLKGHDTSLTESLEYAHNLGYSAKDLNSELLASILATEILIQSFSTYYGEIEEILTNDE